MLKIGDSSFHSCPTYATMPLEWGHRW